MYIAVANKPLKLKEFEVWDKFGALSLPHSSHERNA
jgi:hypothetical protein